MFENYNIICGKKKQVKVSFLESSDDVKAMQGDSSLNEVLECLLSNEFLLRENKIKKLQSKNFYLFDMVSLLKFDTNKNLLEFLNISPIIDYLYENYSVPYCKKCDVAFQELEPSILKFYLKEEPLFIASSFKIKDETKEELSELGINKIIKNDKIFNLKDAENLGNAFAIYQMISYPALDEKLNTFFFDAMKIKKEEISFFKISKEKEVREKIISIKEKIKNDLFICPVCKKIVSKGSVDKNHTMLFNLKEDKFKALSFKEMKNKFLEDKKLSSFLTNLIYRLENHSLFNLENEDKALENFSFFEYVKILLSIIYENFQEDLTLVIKNIYEYLTDSEKEELKKILNKNFENFLIIENKKIKDKAFLGYDFWKVKNYINKNSFTYLGQTKGLYKSFVKLFLSSELVKVSQYCEASFSLEKYIKFLKGEEKGANFKKFKILNLSFDDIMKKNLGELLNIFKGFRSVEKILKTFGDNGFQDDFILSLIGDVNILNFKSISSEK